MTRTFEELLQDIKNRPGVYLGKKKLDGLATFLSGYMCCLNDRNIVDYGNLKGFQEFIEKHYELQDNVKVCRHWSDIISFFNETEEEAFDEFYVLLEQFQKEKNV